MLSGMEEEREKKIHFMRVIYGQELQTIQGAKINSLPCQLANEERVSIEADCNKNVMCTAHIYSFLENLQCCYPPFPIKSDHPTQLLFLSLAHLRNFNTAEYS